MNIKNYRKLKAWFKAHEHQLNYDLFDYEFYKLIELYGNDINLVDINQLYLDIAEDLALERCEAINY